MQGGATVFHEHYKGMVVGYKMYGVGSNTRGEVLRRSPRLLWLRTAQRSGGGRGGTSFPSTGHMVNARALRAEHR